MKIIKNPDKEKYELVTKSVNENNGYCPCMVFQTSETKCICKEFKESKKLGECRCGRFVKVEINE